MDQDDDGLKNGRIAAASIKIKGKTGGDTFVVTHGPILDSGGSDDGVPRGQIIGGYRLTDGESLADIRSRIVIDVARLTGRNESGSDLFQNQGVVRELSHRWIRRTIAEDESRAGRSTGRQKRIAK